jgi:hypothetical protein
MRTAARCRNPNNLVADQEREDTIKQLIYRANDLPEGSAGYAFVEPAQGPVSFERASRLDDRGSRSLRLALGRAGVTQMVCYHDEELPDLRR